MKINYPQFFLQIQIVLFNFITYLIFGMIFKYVWPIKSKRSTSLMSSLGKKIFFSVEGTHMPENQSSIQENIKTLYSDLWKSHNSYISSSQDVLKEIISFMKKNRK